MLNQDKRTRTPVPSGFKRRLAGFARYAIPVLLAPLFIGACQFGGERKLPGNYAAWSGLDEGAAWTRAAERAVGATSLPRQSPNDIRLFCPHYAALEPDGRIRFWVTLLSAMARFESNFNPDTAFTEVLEDSAGNRVVSRGLLQLSIESANQRRYGCAIDDPQDLHDPAINLSCGARILSVWVEADGVVAYADSRIRGGGRYWSVLRPSNRDRDSISAITRDLGICRGTI